MSSFRTDALTNLPLTHSIVRAVARLREFRGREALYEQQAPQMLEALRQAAVIQSTESSNRIEGIGASPARIKALVEHKTKPRNRPEEEIAGYRDVLSTIHSDHAHITFSANVVLQLHRNLFHYAGGGGRWKPVDNTITERLPDGTERLRFQPLPAYRTPEAMDELHRRFDRMWNEEQVDQLLLIPAYVLDFLCIHPFLDGNGRMARLLTHLLLYKAGFGVGRYVSLEMIVERTRESYYDTLYQSSQGWHDGEHTLLPWTEYLLGSLHAAYEDFQARVGELQMARGAKMQMVLDTVDRLPDGFRTRDVERLCPGVSRAWIRSVFGSLQKEGKLRSEGRGAGAVWRKNSDSVQ